MGVFTEEEAAELLAHNLKKPIPLSDDTMGVLKSFNCVRDLLYFDKSA